MMPSNHYVPPMPQYIVGEPAARYGYGCEQPSRPATMQIIEPETQSCRPLEEKLALERSIFSADDRTDRDACDFLSGQVGVEKAQIQILLQQIAARHYISYQVRADLDCREGQLATHAGVLDSHVSGDYGMIQANSDLNRKLADLHRERNMEAVSLWRDTQKALTELFRHWTAYTNLARRARVIDFDL